MKNGFYNIAPDREHKLQLAIDELYTATHYNKKTGTIEWTAENIGAVNTALRHIEVAKTYDFARVATDILTSNDYNKVIISVNYTDTINEIRDFLSFYDPVVLNGKVPANKRADIIRAFNRDPTVRVLIMNTAVGGKGISLHDTIGGAPRFMLISPSYKLLDLGQASFRIWRPGGKSDATVRLFYGNIGDLETKILQSLAMKTQIAKGALEEENKLDMKLPGEYESFFETEA